MLLESRSADRERRDETVDVDAVRTKFLCQVASEANDAKLGADVGDCHRPIPADAARGARGCVDDLAVVLALHQRGGSPRAEKCGFQIAVDHCIPMIDRQPLDRTIVCEVTTGIVDQDIDAPVLIGAVRE